MRMLQRTSDIQRAIMRIRQSVSHIQHMWRGVLAIRKQQQSVFMEQVLLAEGRVLMSNQRKCAVP
jgi:hypothetical protein